MGGSQGGLGLVGDRVEQAPVKRCGGWGRRFLLRASRHARLGQWRGMARSTRESQAKSGRIDRWGRADYHDVVVKMEHVVGRFPGAW
jgi:hypothetical protein